MSLVVELPADLESVLTEEAAQTGISLSDYVTQILSIGRRRKPMTGAEAVAMWEREGIVGMRPDISDPVAYARELRARAETRDRS